MDECIHSGGILDPSWCTMCINGPTLPEKPKVEKPKKVKVQTAPIDPEDVLLQEYLSGVRCMVCDGLRTGVAKHCPHVRAEIAQAHIEEIELWASNHPDTKRGMLTTTAAAGAIGRVVLRGGLRNAPTEVAGLSLGSLMSLARRAESGKPMEWKPQKGGGGDPLPV